MNEAKLIDQFINALYHDPDAVPPPGLDPEVADFVRELARVRQQPMPSPAAEERVWRRALASAQPTATSSHRPKPSTNGHKRTEENHMTTLSIPRQQTPVRALHVAALIAAVLSIVLFGSVLFFSIMRDSPNGPSAVFISPQATNQATFERYINEAWNGGNTDVLPDLLTADHVCHEPGMPDMAGIDSMAAMIANYRTAFPDWLFTVESITATDEEVWAHLTGTGTDDGPFALPDEVMINPTGDTITVEVMLNAHFTDGKITEQWMQSDMLGMLLQTGTLPTPQQAIANAQQAVTVAQNMEVARQAVEAFSNTGTPFDASKYYHDGARWNQGTGKQITTTFTHSERNDWFPSKFWRAFPDAQITIEHITASGDTVVIETTAKGTFEEDFASLWSGGGSVPATNRPETWSWTFVYTFEDGKIINERWYWDWPTQYRN